MKYNQQPRNTTYKPIVFILGTFLLMWICIFALESTYIFSYEMPMALILLFDFTKSASPLIIALLLFRKHLSRKGFVAEYIMGERKRIANYVAVAIIFTLNFCVFYFFRPSTLVLTVPAFLSTFAGQLIFGGGMEEGGWRGYLLPALGEKMPIILAATATSVVWTFWHLPYFFISSSSQYGASFFAYLLVTITTGYFLAAIYMLTKSVLLCTLFHAFSNTLVMTLQADMGNASLMAIYAILSIGAAILCQVLSKQEKKTRLLPLEQRESQ